METIVKVCHLKKYFREIKAVDDISFSVEQGELFGFLGVNGAGKSRKRGCIHPEADWCGVAEQLPG